MISIAVKDLKRPRELREKLELERELFVTKDGRPFAIMIGVEAEGAEDTLAEVRRALFSSAIVRARRRGRATPLSGDDIEAEIQAVRAERQA